MGPVFDVGLVKFEEDLLRHFDPLLNAFGAFHYYGGEVDLPSRYNGQLALSRPRSRRPHNLCDLLTERVPLRNGDFVREHINYMQFAVIKSCHDPTIIQRKHARNRIAHFDCSDQVKVGVGEDLHRGVAEATINFVTVESYAVNWARSAQLFVKCLPERNLIIHRDFLFGRNDENFIVVVFDNFDREGLIGDEGLMDQALRSREHFHIPDLTLVIHNSLLIQCFNVDRLSCVLWREDDLIAELATAIVNGRQGQLAGHPIIIPKLYLILNLRLLVGNYNLLLLISIFQHVQSAEERVNLTGVVFLLFCVAIKILFDFFFEFLQLLFFDCIFTDLFDF